MIARYFVTTIWNVEPGYSEVNPILKAPLCFFYTFGATIKKENRYVIKM
jgi:hypothetical protein